MRDLLIRLVKLGSAAGIIPGGLVFIPLLAILAQTESGKKFIDDKLVKYEFVKKALILAGIIPAPQEV